MPLSHYIKSSNIPDPPKYTLPQRRKRIKELLDRDYELLNEIIIELRNEKLNKINEKIHQNKTR